MRLIILNAHIISPDLDVRRGSILVDAGKVVAVDDSAQPLSDADEVIDAGGRYVMPGFIDIHAHGADGKDVCDNNLESIRHIAKRKLREGVTTWLPTTLTQPQELLAQIAEKCAQYMSHQEYAKTPGLHIEGPYINRNNAGAQNPQFVRKPNWSELDDIANKAPISILSIAPDVEGANDCIAMAKRAGITCSAAHSSATHEQMMLAKEAGLTHLTHFGNAMSALHHREIGMVGSGLLDDDLKMELICDGVHLCPDFLKLMFSVKPIEQLMLITDSMSGSWIDSGQVQLGGLDVIIEGKQARLKDGGALAGSVLRFNEGLRNVFEWTGLPLSQLVKATSWNQAQSLGLKDLGKIEPGYQADMVIMNEDFSVWSTLVDGEVR
ncbi:MAG: N-acetylglucosamine-6-phosphate deacetylase [Akkermansiaceae bacterium]|nr:N-acetylglucosamine-6-phosphate deacetylase [Akkermansiaceae bacterium]